MNSGTKQAIDEVVANEFLLTPDGIYFQNRRANSAIYFWDDTGIGTPIVTDEDVEGLFN